MNTDDVVVDISDLRIDFRSRSGTRTVLESVDVTVRRGDFVSLIGPSGCGKTTLLRSIADLVQPTQGSIRVTGLSPAQARKEGRIGFAFQAAALLDWRTAVDNVALPLQLKGVSTRAARERAREMLEQVGLAAFASHYPGQLSGGMQQRVAIARALVLDSTVLLMDEPFAALDEITRNQMNEWLLELHHSTGMSVIFVTHNIREACLLSDRVLVMSPAAKGIREELDIELPRPRTAEVLDSTSFYTQWREGERALRNASEETAHA